MKILKLLNKKYLSILLIFFLTISLNLKAEEEPVDIWKLKKKDEQDKGEIIFQNEDSSETNVEMENASNPHHKTPTRATVGPSIDAASARGARNIVWGPGVHRLRAHVELC